MTDRVWTLKSGEEVATWEPVEGGGGLPEGWTQDSEDPSNVYTNGEGAGGTGTLTAGTEAGPEQFSVTSLGIGAIDEFGNQWLVVQTGTGLLLTPKLDAGGPAITLDSSQGATIALDGGALPVVDIADPTNPQDAATKAYVDAAIAAALA